MYKLSFAKTINDFDSRLPKGRGDCFDYGSLSGRDFNCPQFQDGKCEGDLQKIFEELSIDEIETVRQKGLYIDEIVKFKSEI